jgi:hypothetical protein
MVFHHNPSSRKCCVLNNMQGTKDNVLCGKITEKKLFFYEESICND